MSTHQTTNQLTVLLVEDSNAIALQIQGYLANCRDTKFISHHVSDLKSAIEHVAKGIYDVILLDLGLPDSQGLDTFTKLHEHAPDIPTVVFTGFDDENVALKALRQGAQDYLVKGEVDSRLLVRAIRYSVERKQIEERLRESEEKHRTLLEALPEIVYKIDPEGKFRFVNKSIKTLGYQSHELIGKHFSTIVHPDDINNISRLVVLNRIKGTTTGDERSPKLLDERRSGDRMTRDLVLKLIPKGWELNNDVNCVIGILTSYGEVTAAGQYKTDEQTSKKHFIGTVGIIKDITERRRVEEEKATLEQQLQQSQKMEAIGRLAGGIAHDINNVLGAILGSASILDIEIDPHDANREDLDNIIAACRKGRDLTRDLLGFARKGKYIKESLSLNEIALEAQSLLARTITKNIAIETNLDQDLKFIEGDRSQIHHALMNLCINAADSIENKGSITITTKNVVISEQQGKKWGGLLPGDYIQIKVIDTGIGMDEETLKNIFEPFYTTKPKGEGTGLGLAMVYGVIENHGGSVIVESELGKGTTVLFLLPTIITSPTARISRPLKESINKPCIYNKGRYILIVDDEQIVRFSLRRLLEKLGYSVYLAESGKAAIEIYKRKQMDISLVLLDIIMPDIDGPETFIALKEINPEVKVLLSSGYSKDEKVEGLLEKGAIGFVQKPFDIQILSNELTAILET